MEKKKKKTPTDINQLAALIVSQTTNGQNVHNVNILPKEKNPATVALGRLGGLKGGKARAEKLTSEKRKEIAEKAARAR